MCPQRIVAGGQVNTERNEIELVEPGSAVRLCASILFRRRIVVIGASRGD